jgi:hypothetical protein
MLNRTYMDLTEAACERNSEAGVLLLDDPLFARSLRPLFESLIVRQFTPGLGS